MVQSNRLNLYQIYPKLCPYKTYNAMNTLQNDHIYIYVNCKKKIMTDDYNCFLCSDVMLRITQKSSMNLIYFRC